MRAKPPPQTTLSIPNLTKTDFHWKEYTLQKVPSHAKHEALLDAKKKGQYESGFDSKQDLHMERKKRSAGSLLKRSANSVSKNGKKKRSDHFAKAFLSSNPSLLQILAKPSSYLSPEIRCISPSHSTKPLHLTLLIKTDDPDQNENQIARFQVPPED